MTCLEFSPDDVDPATATREIERGRARRVRRGVITRDLETPLDTLVHEHVWELVARLLPGAVVTDRTAAVGGQLLHDEDGTARIFVAHPDRARDLELPGLVVSVRTGPGPQPGDLPFMGMLDVRLASPARWLIDNVQLSHGRGGRIARTLTRDELEEAIARLAAQRSPARLAQLREEVERLGDTLEEHDAAAVVSGLIGAAQGTRPDEPVENPQLRARAAGRPIDRQRLQLLEQLAEHLRGRAPRPLITVNDDPRTATLAFHEAYFSNFIEGTEFELDEAAAIIFEGQIPEERPADAHDITGTHAVISDPVRRRRTPASGDELIELLRAHHRTVLSARPEARPGQFKQRANRVGGHVFVAPDEVLGTLHAGYGVLDRLDDPFARAVVMMFLVAEVHPFTDGNGRVARILMNAELSAAGQPRIVIPTVYRNNYLAGLRAMSANGNGAALAAVLDFAQRWTARVDWSTLDTARADLEATNALLDPTAAEDRGIRLQLPDRA